MEQRNGYPYIDERRNNFYKMMEDRSRLTLRKVFSITEKGSKRSLKNERVGILNIPILIAYLN